MTAPEPTRDPRSEREIRGRQAHRRAEEAGARAAELRRQHTDGAVGGALHGSSDTDLALSKRRAHEAADHLVEAVERAAVAHDRAAQLHEQWSDPGDHPAGPDTHDEQAQHHRRAAAADRRLGRRSEERRDAPAD